MAHNTLLKDKECRVELGEFSISLIFDAVKEYIDAIKKYFEDFISVKDPDITIDFKVIQYQEEMLLPSCLLTTKTVNGNSFDFYSGFLKGEIDLDRKYCSIECNVSKKAPRVRYIDQLLHQIYYSLLEKKYGTNKPDKLFVHSSGVLKNGQGYIFVGTSGSGKSTIARLSSEYDILNDETTLIYPGNGGYTVQATPANGGFKLKKNKTGPLNKIFFLKQDTSNYIRKSTVWEYAVEFMKQLVPPIGILATYDSILLTEMMDISLGVLTSVPFYELHFRPEKSLWTCIEQFETNN
jgi:hypothetical protein